MSIDKKITEDLVAAKIGFVTTVPCKQLAGVIDEVDKHPDIFHIPSNKEDEGMGLCAGAWMGGTRPMIISSAAATVDSHRSTTADSDWMGRPFIVWPRRRSR